MHQNLTRKNYPGLPGPYKHILRNTVTGIYSRPIKQHAVDLASSLSSISILFNTSIQVNLVKSLASCLGYYEY